MEQTYKFADIVVRISSMHQSIHDLCKDYISFEPSFNMKISIFNDDINYEREKTRREYELEGKIERSFTDEYLETLAIYRKIAESMPEYNTFLFHGSCVAVDGRGYLFAAKSGTGKSTHTRLWRKLFGGRAVMVNDDKPLIRVDDDEVRIFGTPWDGKHRLSTNISVPLKAICFIERAEENVIRRITKNEAYPLFLQQTYRPQDRNSLSKTLTLIDRVATNVTLWKLGCNMSIEAAKTAYEAMKG